MSAEIRNWWVTSAGSPYTPPECRQVVVKGEVIGHPSRPAGERVVVPVDVEDGRAALVLDGVRLALGAPLPDYLAWLRENGYEMDPADPIRVRRRAEDLVVLPANKRDPW